MGRQPSGLDFGAIARLVAAAVGALALAHCSGSLTTSDGNYSKRVVEEGEPVPKGGGTYRVGRPYNVNGRTYVPTEDPNYRVEGIASWYGPDFHGRLTANGEVYDMHAISAAHPTMPLPSYARVTNLDNGRSIIVRVNDRGPYTRNRIVDLSIGTAKALNFYGNGLARVRLEYVGRAPLEGSDDRMLMATLREGRPAPAPSKVMVAAAKPFIPEPEVTPLPTERPYALGTGPRRLVPEPRAGEVNLVARAPAGAGTRSASAAESRAEAPAFVPIMGAAPTRNEGPALGLMSGRGLY